MTFMVRVGASRPTGQYATAEEAIAAAEHYNETHPRFVAGHGGRMIPQARATAVDAKWYPIRGELEVGR